MPGLGDGSDQVTQARRERWRSTMEGWHLEDLGLRQAHADAAASVTVGAFDIFDRTRREEAEDGWLAPGATRAIGAGKRLHEEEADDLRTCFERDRDRILHSSAFRRLAGKTQVFIFPADHQRTRLTHALEVTQVASSIAQACRLNVALIEAVALGHDCGHGPGGHASEDALGIFLEGGFDHAVWGAEVTTQSLNLCAETIDGIRNHSWSRPTPFTPEGQLVGLADRIAYCAHDLEDAVSAGIVVSSDLPASVTAFCGTERSGQLRAFISDVIATAHRTGRVGLSVEAADALSELRRFNYERIYLRPESTTEAKNVIDMLRALVEHLAKHPELLPPEPGEPLQRAVTWVSGMTDRFAWQSALDLLNWPVARLPRGLDSPSSQ